MIRYLVAAYLVFVIVAAHAQEGFHGKDHEMWHHDFYSTLTNKGFSCCNDADCRPTQSRSNGDHYEVMLDGEWTYVEPSKILKKQAPDGGAHVCAPPQIGTGKGLLYCVILPAEG